ncbi:hypothetical protein SG0102_22060 [Intestinibaculum porci]|uniref:Abi family protein n=1 Tax=Intestinibaculum porci TaxID=2487118 RepID=A0A3G9J9P0_9FIRM|nr:Abi family protein [Intestinibaculum porci]BBH27272.1 hypothetical protein SG0102_22060 [Intestinibaculum porci]
MILIHSEKNFQTLENQIRILKAKGLVIQNPSVAKKWLSQCNYYNFINGYKELFLDYKRINEDPHHHEVFKPNTTIEELKPLYDFDRELRILTLKYLFIIERKFKSNLAYYFEQFHKSPNAYLYAENYDQTRTKNVNRTIIILKKEYNRASRTETSHKHYIKSIEHVPLWVFINFISFGTCSKMYKNMNSREQTLISKSIAPSLEIQDLSAFMEYLTNIRNICAHDERLYAYICSSMPPGMPLMQYFHLSEKARKSYFGLIITLKYFLSRKEFNSYYHKLKILFQNLDSHTHTMSIKKVYRKMGFPHNWKNINHI